MTFLEDMEFSEEIKAIFHQFLFETSNQNTNIMRSKLKTSADTLYPVAICRLIKLAFKSFDMVFLFLLIIYTQDIIVRYNTIDRISDIFKIFVEVGYTYPSTFNDIMENLLEKDFTKRNYSLL